MFKKLISKSVGDKVGHSKVVDSLKDSYDYIIGLFYTYIVMYCIYS